MLQKLNENIYFAFVVSSINFNYTYCSVHILQEYSRNSLFCSIDLTKLVQGSKDGLFVPTCTSSLQINTWQNLK